MVEQGYGPRASREGELWTPSRVLADLCQLTHAHYTAHVDRYELCRILDVGRLEPRSMGVSVEHARHRALLVCPNLEPPHLMILTVLG